MIEHVDKDFARHLLAEAFPMLKAGAPIRIVTPGLGFLSKLASGTGGADSLRYIDFMRDVSNGEVASPCDTVNYAFYNYGRCYLYSPTELAALIEAANPSPAEAAASRPRPQVGRPWISPAGAFPLGSPPGT